MVGIKMKRGNKKGQFKIQQMAFMLTAVVLFFILVALFWVAFQYRGIKQEATQLEREKTIQMSEFLSSSSEFSCYEANCIDTDKLIVLENRSLMYKELWPVSYIKIRKIYDWEGNDVVCNKANYPDCNVFELYGKEEGGGIGSFVALCRHDRINDFPVRICELGKIIIGYESKLK